jgi:hypothetical protein
MLTHYLNIWFPAVGLAFVNFTYLVTVTTDHLQTKHWPKSTDKAVESAEEEVRGDSRTKAFVRRICFTYYATSEPRESPQFGFNIWNGSRVQAKAAIARYSVASGVALLTLSISDIKDFGNSKSDSIARW